MGNAGLQIHGDKGQPRVDMSEVARHLEIPVEEILRMFGDTEPGKYIITKDKVYTIQ